MSDHSAIRISVIIPVLNAAATLSRAVQSVIQQDYPHIEIIIIDGGSNDGTLDIIREFDKRIFYWESGKDRGISDAFNRGIERATGNLVAILNSDDTWEACAAKNVLQAVKECPDADIYYGKVRYVDPVTAISYIRSPNISLMKKRMFMFHPSIFVKKTAYQRVGKYSERYKFAMDSQWLHRAIAAGLKFKFVDAVLADMYLGGVSDKRFVFALNEYRKSLIECGIASPWYANINFIKYVCLKSVMQVPWLRKCKQKFLR